MRPCLISCCFTVFIFLTGCGKNYAAKYRADERIPPARLVSEARKAQKLSKAQLIDSVRLHKDILSSRSRLRKKAKGMNATYITIHSTQNWSRTSHAVNHMIALSNYKTGGNSWHFTVDQYRAIQHLKLNETGAHAGNSTGNAKSIGIEMCENRGSNLHATVERAARLTAWLMLKEGIPIERVVPHYHWDRGGRDAHKNCPHFLMESDGKPGAKWYAFKKKVYYYYRNAK